MIALRGQIERGLANPWLRPLLIVLLAVVLAFLVLHAAHDGAASEVGAACFGLAVVLSAVLLEVVRAFVRPRLVRVCLGRAPPPPRRANSERAFRTGPILIPLRR